MSFRRPINMNIPRRATLLRNYKFCKLKMLDLIELFLLCDILSFCIDFRKRTHCKLSLEIIQPQPATEIKYHMQSSMQNSEKNFLRQKI